MKKIIKKSGRWEIDYFPEPIFGLLSPDGTPFNMLMISDEESYFVFASHVARLHESIEQSLEIVWKVALSKSTVLPNSIVVKKEELVHYVGNITKELHIPILHVKKLKAIPDAVRSMKRMYAKSGVNRFAPAIEKPSKHDFYYDAMEAMCAGKINDAINLLKKSLKIDPRYVNAYQGLSAVYRKIGDKKMYHKHVLKGYEETLRVFKKLPDELSWHVIENRQYLRAIFNMATLHIENNEFEKGIVLYRQLLKMCPQDGLGARYYVALLYDGKSINDIEKLWDWSNETQGWKVMEKIFKSQNKIHKFWKEPHY